MLKKGICHDYEYKHSSCSYLSQYETNELCKHYKDSRLMTEEETDEWYKRGCEGWFPTAMYCKKFKRDWKKTIKYFIDLIFVVWSA